MEAVIKKWGNSPALRLSVSALKEADFSVGQSVNITVSRGRIVIEPSHQVVYDLDQLLNDITPENLHAETGTGAPRGLEAF